MVFPHWLSKLAPLLAQAELALRGEADPVYIALSVPPQHGKSTYIYNWLVRTLGRYPYLNSGYATYGQKLSDKQSRRARRVAKAAGIELEKDTLGEWVTSEGGGIIWTSIGGAITGDPISGVAIVDDPFKNRKEAESQTVRENAVDFYEDDWMSRIHPGVSEILINTRWHVSDLTGVRLEKEGTVEEGGKWTVCNLPAIIVDAAGNERALWPEGRPLPWLYKRRASVTEYAWWSMYMGEPRPRGSSLFGLATTCKLADVPTQGTWSIGIDLAYTAKTKSDHTVAVVLVQSGEKIYVADVLRFQKQIEESTEDLAKLCRGYIGAPVHWHTGGTESVTVARRLRDGGVPVKAIPAVGDKFVRSQDVAAAWQQGRVIVPRDASWSRVFVDEISAFSGVSDVHDDQVDALASAFDALSRTLVIPQSAAPRTFASSGAGGWRNY